MTIMRVTLVGVELTPEQKSDLARRLIAAFCEIEVGTDIAAAHSGFVVHIEEGRPESVFLGDEPMTSASAVERAAIISWRSSVKKGASRAPHPPPGGPSLKPRRLRSVVSRPRPCRL